MLKNILKNYSKNFNDFKGFRRILNAALEIERLQNVPINN